MTRDAPASAYNSAVSQAKNLTSATCTVAQYKPYIIRYICDDEGRTGHCSEPRRNRQANRPKPNVAQPWRAHVDLVRLVHPRRAAARSPPSSRGESSATNFAVIESTTKTAPPLAPTSIRRESGVKLRRVTEAAFGSLTRVRDRMTWLRAGGWVRRAEGGCCAARVAARAAARTHTCGSNPAIARSDRRGRRRRSPSRRSPARSS